MVSRRGVWPLLRAPIGPKTKVLFRRSHFCFLHAARHVFSTAFWRAFWPREESLPMAACAGGFRWDRRNRKSPGTARRKTPCEKQCKKVHICLFYRRLLKGIFADFCSPKWGEKALFWVVEKRGVGRAVSGVHGSTKNTSKTCRPGPSRSLCFPARFPRPWRKRFLSETGRFKVGGQARAPRYVWGLERRSFGPYQARADAVAARKCVSSEPPRSEAAGLVTAGRGRCALPFPFISAGWGRLAQNYALSFLPSSPFSCLTFPARPLPRRAPIAASPSRPATCGASTAATPAT